MEVTDKVVFMINQAFPWIVFVVFLFVISSYSNWRAFRYLFKAERQYSIFLEYANKEELSHDESEKCKKAARWLRQAPIQLRELYERAGIEEPKITQVVPKGLNHVETQYIPVLGNLTFVNQDIMNRFLNSLESAKGYYKYQAWQNLNPLHWIEVIAFLPQYLLKFFHHEKVGSWLGNLVNAIQLVYWLIAGTLFVLAL